MVLFFELMEAFVCKCFFCRCLFFQIFFLITEQMGELGSLVVPLPVTGLATYVKRCCEDKFCSYAESYGISVIDVKVQSESLLVKYYKPTPTYNEDNLRTLVIQFSRSILTSFSVRYINLIIPWNLFTNVQSQAERYSLKYYWMLFD